MSAMSGPSPTRILIVGAGAVGCFYASRLHRPSANVLVSLVCRSNYEAIASKGVTLRTRAFGNYVFTPEHVFPSIPAAAKQKIPWDYVVVTTKALPDVSDDSELIHDLITSESSTVVLIQNGVGVEEPYRKRFPKNVILSAVTIISAEQVEHGVIVQNRWTRISIGPYTDGLGSRELGAGDAKIKDFVGLLSEGGIKDAELYDERGLQMVRWHKIAINASMNPSSVLSNGTPNARMTQDQELRHHLRECMFEVFRGAEAVLGTPLPSSLARPDKILTSTERNEGGKSSMSLDWERGGSMELEVILGNPIRLARAKGVEMPRLQAMYALLKMAQTRRDEKNKDSRKGSKL